jgi:DnaK suppressor protein
MTRASGDVAVIRAAPANGLDACRAAPSATAADRKPVELDQASVGRLSRLDAIQRQAMALAAENQRRTQMRKLEAAIERLDAGEFGYCVRCGHEIDDRRLAIDSAVPSCIDCARQR